MRFNSVQSVRTVTVSTPLKWSQGLSGLSSSRTELSVGSESFCGSKISVA